MLTSCVANTAQTWFQWDVTTDSTNSSEIYVFRIVNGTGTAEQKAAGGFLSAAFYISVKDTSASTSTLSTLTVSATEPVKTSASSSMWPLEPCYVVVLTCALASEATPTTTSTTTTTPNTGTSQGAKIGIGVGVGVGVLGLGALAAAFIFWRKSKGKQQPPGPQPYEMPLNGDFSPHYQSAQPYDNNHQSLAGYYKPPEIGETRGTELDAGQGHQFVPEATLDNRVGRVELQ